MKLAHWHKSRGDEVYFTPRINRSFLEPEYDIIYGSTVFTFSQKRTEQFKALWPGAVVGGTGTGNPGTIEQIIGTEYEHYDYSIYPEYQWSIGFTQRGCRLNCGFCVVPKKEGRPRSINTIYDIWRPDTPRHVCLLDNDFFGQPKEQWLQRIGEIKTGGFKVCFNQGINIRLVTDEAAYWLNQIRYYDDQFKNRRLYTAWDNLRDERIFFEGVGRLEQAGIPPSHLMVYMLIGFDPSETMERILYRFERMTARGILPYPMVYNNQDKELKKFQRWAVRRYYKIVPWLEYRRDFAKYLPVKEQATLWAEQGAAAVGAAEDILCSDIPY
jgi:hypothetical protein